MYRQKMTRAVQIAKLVQIGHTIWRNKYREDTAVTIISIVKSLCQQGMLHDMLSAPSSSSATSTYNKAASLTKNTIYTPLIHSLQEWELENPERKQPTDRAASHDLSRRWEKAVTLG